MANLNGQNYAKQYVTKPSEKIQMGEKAGRKRLIFDKVVLSQAFAAGEKVILGNIPADSIVTDAKIKIDKSLGATGIFDLGFAANGVDAADADAFVVAADGGGQAVLKRASELNVGIHKRFTAETPLEVICTEIMDGTVLDAVMSIEIEYVND